MSDTIDFYNKNAVSYFSSTKDISLVGLCERFLKHVREGGVILDLGCGSGRDSLYFKSRGFRVEAVDGSVEMCKIASGVLGQEVRCCRFEDLDYSGYFDAIWANASLLHVYSNDLINIIRRVVKGLREGGVMFMSFKRGSGDIDEGGRHFTYLDEFSVRSLLGQIEEVKVLEVFECGHCWVNVILMRRGMLEKNSLKMGKFFSVGSYFRAFSCNSYQLGRDRLFFVFRVEEGVRGQTGDKEFIDRIFCLDNRGLESIFNDNYWVRQELFMYHKLFHVCLFRFIEEVTEREFASHLLVD